MVFGLESWFVAAGDGMTDAEKGQFKALGAEEDNSTPEKDTVKEQESSRT